VDQDTGLFQDLAPSLCLGVDLECSQFMGTCVRRRWTKFENQLYKLFEPGLVRVREVKDYGTP